MIDPSQTPLPAAQGGSPADLPAHWLSAYPQGVMIEYTSRCNLRCRYCSKSDPGDDQIPGRDMDMSRETVDSVLAFLAQNRFQELFLSGTGESTFNPHWLEDFPRFVSVAKAANPACFINVNSNFATKYDDEHWAAFALLDSVTVSIDSIDPKLTKEVRAKSDLALIVFNILRFKAYCDSHDLKCPKLTINATLYQEAAPRLPELVSLLANLPISHVSISDLFETEGCHVYGVRPVNSDNVAAFAAAVTGVQQAINRAQTLGRFTVSLQPHLVERINALVAQANAGGAGIAATPVAHVPPGQTKVCLQPWTRFTIAADAALYPCCVTGMAPVGSMAAGADEQEDGLNGTRFRNFRRALLTGDVPAICVGCSNAASGPVQQLQQTVDALVKLGTTSN